MIKEKVIYKIKVETNKVIYFKIKCYELDYALNLIKNIVGTDYKILNIGVQNYDK